MTGYTGYTGYTGSSRTSSLQITNGSFTTTITSAVTTNHTLKLPAIQSSGPTGYYLSNDGSGNLSWTFVPQLYYALQRTFIDLDLNSTPFSTSKDIPSLETYNVLPISSEDKVGAVGGGLGNPPVDTGITDTQLRMTDYDPFRIRQSDSSIRIPSNGWYQISYYLHHPKRNIATTPANVSTDGQDPLGGGLGNFTIGLLFNSGKIEYAMQDLNGGTPDTCNYIATVWLVANNTITFIFSTNAITRTDNQDFLARISIIRLTDGTGNRVL